MILEGCQTIQWRRHFDQIPSLLIFFLRFFLERIQCVSSSTRRSGSKGFEGIRRLVLYSIRVPENTFDALSLLFLMLPPLIAVKYRFQDFVRVSRLDIRVKENILARIRVSDIVWEIPPNFWIAICVLHDGDWSRMILIFWIFSFFVAIINF